MAEPCPEKSCCTCLRHSLCDNICVNVNIKCGPKWNDIKLWVIICNKTEAWLLSEPYIRSFDLYNENGWRFCACILKFVKYECYWIHLCKCIYALNNNYKLWIANEFMQKSSNPSHLEFELCVWYMSSFQYIDLI